jgi:hypothetical protein
VLHADSPGDCAIAASGPDGGWRNKALDDRWVRASADSSAI